MAVPTNVSRLVVAAGVAMAATAAASARQGPTLESLTVPSAGLPEGCRLRPADEQPAPVARGNALTTSQPAHPNPWIGRDRDLVIRVRTMIDGYPALPDAPPLSPRERTALETRWIAGVTEAYWARYVSDPGQTIDVYALRFADEKSVVRPPRGGAAIVRGPIVARVVGDPWSACFDAIVRHVGAPDPSAGPPVGPQSPPTKFELTGGLADRAPLFRPYDARRDAVEGAKLLSSSSFGSRSLRLLEESDLTRVPYDQALVRAVVVDQGTPAVTVSIRGYRTYSFTWINDDLLHVFSSPGRCVTLDWVYDVPARKVVYNAAFQHCGDGLTRPRP